MGTRWRFMCPSLWKLSLESKILMLSTNNVLSPANGKPLMSPTQDMVLGLYWITREREGMKGEGKILDSKSDVSSAYEHGQVDLHAKIKVRIGRDVAETTVGRTLLSLMIPEE